MSFESDYYERLGLDPAQEAKLIRRQYRLLARLFHPDVSDAPDAQARFVALQEAYDVLSDEAKRMEYDQWLDTQPLTQPPFRMSVQLFPPTLCRNHPLQRVYALIEISTLAAAKSEGIPLNLLLVLDRSLSMKGRRLFYIKEAARRIIQNLSVQDTFGIVVFNDRASVVLPVGRATDTSVAQSALDSIQPAGGTEIATGLRLGLQEVMRNHSPQGISHIILLTDGRTYGDEAQSLELAERAAEMNIGLTALGLGTDWNDVFLDDLARRAGGRAHFIAEPKQAVESFHTQLKKLQGTFARNTQLLLNLEPGVTLLQTHEVNPGLRDLPEVAGEVFLGELPATPPLRLLLDFQVELPERDVMQLGNFLLRGQLVKDGSTREIERWPVVDVDDKEMEAPPSDVYQAAKRVATLCLQERAWEAVDHGQKELVVSTLGHLADRFLDIGASELALATQREMEIYQKTGSLSEDGRKLIKYGTRRLALPSPE